uniref:hypothetical protein n=1 Tax=Flavobacterium sp. TaxID=239 RepID=UPI00374D6646
MKQKLKKIKILFAITLAGFLLFSCQEDFYYEQNQSQNLQVKEINFSKAKEIKKFDNAITEV